MQIPLEIPASLDLAAMQAAQPERFPLLLNSSSFPGASVAGETGAINGRWDILFCSSGEVIELTSDGQLRSNGGAPDCQSDGFLEALDAWFAVCYRTSTAPDALPFAGGWCLYLAYELLASIEPSVPTASPDDGLPLALAIRCPAAILADRAMRRTWLIFEPGYDQLVREVRTCCEAHSGLHPQALPTLASIQEEPDEDYLNAVARAREYIAAGDVFQVNLSREWNATFDRDVPPTLLWEQLNRANPSPFAGLLRWKDVALISSSPERLVQVAGPVVQTRPIAGTRPRVDPKHDALRRSELVGNPKERAEHVMLLDLERNDLGRICRPGTVRVDEFMAVESYAHVHHIVSNVTGRLRRDATPGKVLSAVFPGGTITGCPKVRCMQIIYELESGPRGAYTGSLGYLDHRGRMDLNILIRSLVLRGRRVRFRAGAGIVADSDPRRELEETRAKARGLLQALRPPEAAIGTA